MSKVISIRLPDRLYAMLKQHAVGRGMEVSVAARDLIRRGVGISEHESITEEARIEARRDLHRQLNGAMYGDE